MTYIHHPSTLEGHVAFNICPLFVKVKYIIDIKESNIKNVHYFKSEQFLIFSFLHHSGSSISEK